MKRTLICGICLTLLMVITACGQKTDVKPDNNTTQQNNYDKMNDTSFNNVMSVLRESLEQEKKSNDSSSKLNTAKAYILVIKFIRADKDKVKKSGMTDTDISFLVSDAKEKAKLRLSDILGSQTAPQSIKDEATAKNRELDTL